MWIALVLALALIVPMATVAYAVVDEFGGGTFAAPYAPYTAGPVVSEEPYAPYVAGPVIHTSDYAPFTETPYVPMNSTHWMIR
jgi:hypothetical protein